MAIAFAQTANLNNPGSNPVTCAFTGNTVTGNIIIVGVAIGGAEIVSSISDSAGNSGYVKAIATPTTNGFPVEMWYKENATGGTTPTVSVTLNTGQQAVVEIYEFSGVATSSSADGTGQSGTGTSTSIALTTGLTTTNANDLLMSFCNSAGSNSAGPASWTTETTFFSAAYRIVAATSTYTATFTQSPSQVFSVVAFAFKAASAGSVPSVSANPKILFP